MASDSSQSPLLRGNTRYGSDVAIQVNQPPTPLVPTQEESGHGRQRETGKKDAEQASDPATTIADKLEKELCSNCWYIFIRFFDFFGFVAVVFGFGMLFKEDWMKASDIVSASGGAVSFVANFGLFLLDRQLKYVTKKHIKELDEEIQSKHDKPSKNVVKTITLLSLRHKDSVEVKKSCLHKWVQCVCLKGCFRSCCCQENCLPEDTSKPVCTMNPYKYLCCTCGRQKNQDESNDGASGNKNENNSATCCCCLPNCCRCTFLLTLDFWARTYSMASSGWICSNNLRATFDQFRHNKIPSTFDHMTWPNQTLECIDLIIACLSLIFIICAYRKACWKAVCKIACCETACNKTTCCNECHEDYCGKDKSFVDEIKELTQNPDNQNHN